MSTKSKLLLVVFNAILILLFTLILPVRFEENDDVMMLLFSSGSYTGHPENVLVFINYLYGSVLQVFYSVLPNFEWYTLFFLFFHVISVSVLSYEILRNQTNKITKVILLLILYLFEVRLLFQLQFTTTAALLALSGLILLNKKSYINYFLGALFFITASLIRFEAAFLVLLVIFPLFLKNYIRANKNLKIKIVFALTLVVGLAYGLKFVDYSYVNQHQEWRNYYEYNKVRGKINDNPNFARTNFDIESVEKDDIFWLDNFFPDAMVLTTDMLNQIHQQVDATSIDNKMQNIYPSLRQYTLILGVFSLIILILLINLNISEKIFIAMHYLLFIAALCFVSLNATLNYRVFLSALIPLFYVIVCSIPNISLKIYHHFILSLLSLFFVIFAFRNYKLWNQKHQWASNEFFTQTKLITNFYNTKPKAMLVVFPADFSVEFFNALSTSGYFVDKNILYAGWLTNIPYNKSFKSHNDLINNSLFISKTNFNEKLPVLIRSIERNYHVELNVIVESEFNKYMIVRLEDKRKN